MMSVMLAQRLDESYALGFAGDFSTKAAYLAERWNGSLNVLGISGMFCLSLVPYGIIKCVGEIDATAMANYLMLLSKVGKFG
ncbi:hypothetical protein SLEP1_g57330 [Rubroshorea leprosula]|uniref:Uncharacterized protein n=1 Tax=Rubroshorea leprosula TaxID=152421 RepID=A0AAV5MLC8_9ROSI|nr:hypothetical protein SLEP1_g57330 [Rubroshorea leprosula]